MKRECTVIGMKYPECREALIADTKYLVSFRDDSVFVVVLWKGDGYAEYPDGTPIGDDRLTNSRTVFYTLPSYEAGKGVNVVPEAIAEHILEAWNAANIIHHRSLNDLMRAAVKFAMKNYSYEEILKAIKNYGVVVNRPNSSFTYHWTMIDFLKRGNAIPKFLDDICLKQYIKAPPKINPRDQREEYPLRGSYPGADGR